MSRRLFVAHATNLLQRGFHSVSTDRVAADGSPANALFAVARSLLRSLAFKQPELAIAVLDADAPATMPAALASQEAQLEHLLATHGLRVVRAADARHIVASYTQAGLDDGCDVIVVGGDKRLAQLVADDVWWYDAFKDVRYTPELVRKRFEVGPDRVDQWLALVGDNEALPGVKGIGKKGATTLIGDHGSVHAALEVVDEIGGRTGKALRAAAADARRELERAVLDRNRPLPVPLAELAYEPPAPRRVQELYGSLGFFELLSSDADEAEIAVQILDSPDLLEPALAKFDDSPVAVQALIEDPSPPRGDLTGLALAQGGRIVYVPFVGPGGGLEQGPAALAAFLSDRERRFVGHNVKAIAVALARHGIELGPVVGDAACASHLAEPSNRAPHDLPDIARHVLRRALVEDESVRGVGRRRKRWDAVAVEKAARFAARWAECGEAAWQALAPETDPTLLAEYLALSDTLTRMERRGIGCDRVDLARAGSDFERIAAELEASIFEIAGKSFNLGSTKQLGAVLFEDLKLPIVKRTKTGWSTANDALERIEHAHPIVALVIRWRRLRRLMDSWVTALTAAIDSDGRVRSTFHPARSFSGRLVNSHPDLGRVPGRTPEMARIRHAFAAPAGSCMLSLDYRQLGLYVLAHLSEDPALVEPLAAQMDMHVLTAAAVLEREPDAIDADARQLGKIINFATFAGQGASALGMQLGVEPSEAKGFIARFNDRYSVVRSFQDRQLELARGRGYIETIAGRRWPIGGLASPDPMDRAYAERLARRATHEGSVADVSRRGLLRADEALRAAGLRSAPLLQVHDEVLFEVPDGELEDAARVAGDAMRSAFDLVVPLRVGAKAGPNWAELEPI